MSASETKSATIRLVAVGPATVLSVVDADYHVVAQGLDRLEVPVAPGAYRLEYRCGPETRSQLVTVLDGETFTDDAVAVAAMPSPAPVRGARTTTTAAEQCVSRASAALTEAPGGGTGLIVMVRALDDQELLPREALGMGLLDGVGRSAAEPAWTPCPGENALLWSTPLAPGGYILEAPHPDADGLAVRQVLWISEGWQTLVFAPARRGRGAFTDASIHLAPAASGWKAADPVNLRAEVALWDARADGRFSPRSIASCLGTVESNPMLALLQLHRRAGPPDDAALALLAELEQALPAHPDVRVLAADLAVAGAAEARRVEQFDWPPMLLANYRALQQLDARRLGVIRAGTVAESAASALVRDGVWTGWDGHPRPNGTGGGGELEVTEGSLHPATQRIAAHLERVAALEGEENGRDVLSIDANTVALATGLSSAAAARGLSDLEAASDAEPAEQAQPAERGAAAAPSPAPGKLSDLTPKERHVRAVARTLALVTGVLAALWLWTTAAGLVDPVMAVGIITQLLLVGFLLVLVAGDVRRFAALPAAVAGIAAASALLGLWAAAIADGDDIAVLWWDVDERLALVVNAVSALGFATILGLAAIRAQRDRYGLKTLSAGGRRTLSAVGSAYAPPSSPVSGDDIAGHADRYLAQLDRRRRLPFKLALRAVALVPLFSLRATLSLLSREDCRDVLLRLAHGRGWSRAVGVVIARRCHELAALGYHADSRVVREILRDRESVGPQGPRPARPRLKVERSSDVDGETTTADVVVVGSGICGALMAYRLAESGQSVLIVEQGAYVRPTRSDPGSLQGVYEKRGAHRMRNFDARYRRVMGVGGSSLLGDPEWAMVPEPVVTSWNADPHRAGIDELGFEQALERVKTLVPGLSRPSGTLSSGACDLTSGLQKLGVTLSGLAEPDKEAAEQGNMELSARSGAALDTLLPWGQRRFGERLRLLARCRAEKIVRHDDGVEIRCRGRDGERLAVRAGAVVIAAGPVEASMLLLHSKMGGKRVGRDVSYVVSSSVVGDFGRVLDADLGVQVTLYAGERPQGFVVRSEWEPLPLQAMMMPGWFDDHVQNMSRYRHMTAGTAMVAIENAGKVTRFGAQLAPKPHQLDPIADRLATVANALFAAGAERVLPVAREQHEVRPGDDVLGVLQPLVRSGDLVLRPRPQGGNALGEGPEHGVVDGRFRVHGEKHVYVCDPSVFPKPVTVAPGLTALALAEYAAPSIAADLA